MRQGQQNRRGRGRNNNNNNNNNNRKSQNPLMRSFESSGPDVKIRGTPSHIAEKYITLARDALSSGDPVLAENYLQHAEHYNRIILGYREQMAQQGGADPMGMGNGAARTHSLAGPEGSDGDEFGDEEGDEFGVQQPLGGQGGGQPDLQQPFQQQPRATSIIPIRTATKIARRAMIGTTTIAMTVATDSVSTVMIAMIGAATGRISAAIVG